MAYASYIYINMYIGYNKSFQLNNLINKLFYLPKTSRLLERNQF